MKKLIATVAIVTIISFAAKAQNSGKKINFSIGANVGSATTKPYTTVFGGNLQVDFPVAENTKISAGAGYESFSYKIGPGAGNGGATYVGNLAYIPLLGGIQFFFSPKFYGQAKLGYSIATNNGGLGAFTYSPLISYLLSKKTEITAQYFAMSFSGGTIGSVLGGLRLNFGDK